MDENVPYKASSASSKLKKSLSVKDLSRIQIKEYFLSSFKQHFIFNMEYNCNILPYIFLSDENSAKGKNLLGKKILADISSQELSNNSDLINKMFNVIIN